MITPNQAPFPAAPWNNPAVAPLLQSMDAPLTIGQVPEETAIGADDFRMMETPLGPRNNLMSMRSKFPYLPVMPLPPQSVSVLLAANTAVDINLPDQGSVMIVRGNNDYYLNLHGRADIPVDASGICKSLYKPEQFAFYVGNLKQFSLIAPNANTIVTCLFYVWDELPTY